MQLAEDLGAEPVWVVNNGVSHEESVPAGRIQSWVQDALDSIECVCRSGVNSGSDLAVTSCWPYCSALAGCSTEDSVSQ